MSPLIVLTVISGYFAVLFLISKITSRKVDTETYFTGNRQSPWYVVAYGMIGATLSGVTFISVPGWVTSTQFSYMMVVIGYLLGYFTMPWCCCHCITNSGLPQFTITSKAGLVFGRTKPALFIFCFRG